MRLELCVQHFLSFSDILWLRCVFQREPVLLKIIFFLWNVNVATFLRRLWRLTNLDVFRSLSRWKDMLSCRDYRWRSELVEISAGYWCGWEHRTWSHCTYVLWPTLVHYSPWGTFWNQASIEYARCIPYETAQNNSMYETITLFRGTVFVFLSTKVNPTLLHRLIILSTVVHSYFCSYS